MPEGLTDDDIFASRLLRLNEEERKKEWSGALSGVLACACVVCVAVANESQSCCWCAVAVMLQLVVCAAAGWIEAEGREKGSERLEWQRELRSIDRSTRGQAIGRSIKARVVERGWQLRARREWSRPDLCSSTLLLAALWLPQERERKAMRRSESWGTRRSVRAASLNDASKFQSELMD